MANLAETKQPSTLETLSEILRCPRCGSHFSIGTRLLCENGHHYAVVHGVPRLVEEAWQRKADVNLTEATSDAFGEQWIEMGEDAGVTLRDLQLHLPKGWDLSVFKGDVVDAGCGMGRYTTLVAGLGARVIGSDLSEAVDKAAQLWPDVPFVQADLVAPPFEEQSLDVVFSFGVLHHLPDPLRGWKTCYKLVAPGGLMLAWVYSEHGGLLRRGRRWFRALTHRLPFLLTPVAASAAIAIWLGLLARGVTGLSSGNAKLAFYADKGLKQLYVDCHDALAAPSEMYLTPDDCRTWLGAITTSSGGFERRSDGSGWIIWARR